MPPVKALDRVVKKFITNFGGAQPEYEAGISAPRRPWQEAATAAEAIYVQAVTAAAQAGRRAAGIARAGNAKWQDRARRLGGGRLSQAAPVAGEAFGREFAAVRSAVEAVQLPAAGAKGSPQQAQRMTAMRDALIGIGRARRGGR